MPEKESAGQDRRPIMYAAAFAMVVIALAVSYRIIRTNGAIDVNGGLNGIQVKISEAQKTIESAQQQMTEAQRQLDQRDAALRASEEALKAREAKVENLLAGLGSTPASPTPRLSPREARVELDRLKATAPVAPAAVAPVGPQLDKLGELRDKLKKTNTDIKLASKPLTEQMQQ